MKQGPPTARERAEVVRILNALYGTAPGYVHSSEIQDDHPSFIALLHHVRVEREVHKATLAAERQRRRTSRKARDIA